jgi:3-mercaptopyruvate sulfurtransferase SseA
MRVWGWLAVVVLSAAAVMIAGCSRDKLGANSPGANGANGNATTAASRNTPPDNVRRVTISELRDMLDQNKAVLVDVRGDGAYQQEHIKGALDIPENQLVARAGELPKDKLIVLYCS